MKVSLAEAPPDPETLPPLDLAPLPRTAPLTEDAPERILKLTIVSRYRCGYYSHSIVPEIRFGGRYLEEFKFLIGTRLRITVKKGRIIIKPDRYQPWLPENVAREVREASAIDKT
ncbi:MAG TPA: hypothetical protein VGS79_27035 [Puia sp.]|nr:hypothetical protein [Puia sp.]